MWPQIFLFPETKDFYNFLQGKTGLQHQMLGFGGLEVAEIQSFTWLSNIAHENLLMKEWLIRGQEDGCEGSLALLSSHSSAALSSVLRHRALVAKGKLCHCVEGNGESLFPLAGNLKPVMSFLGWRKTPILDASSSLGGSVRLWGFFPASSAGVSFVNCDLCQGTVWAQSLASH